jgi:deazaflavin-dependent oxidoreductase (nitroreductase family)
MAYRKPNVFTRRMFNPLAMKFGIGGSKTLAVPGRRTGKIERVPLIVLEHGDGRYLVSPRGETDWVRNLRAAGGNAELSGRHATERLRATEVSVAERPPIIAAYQKLAGRAVESHFKALPDPADHPVFRIESR